MASFTGILPKKVIATPDLRSTINIKSLAINQVQKRIFVKVVPGAGAYSALGPTYTQHSSYGGGVVEFLAAFIYNRMHITPRELALGNIIGVQQRDIFLWNAWLVPRTLTSLSKDNTEAIDITNQPDPPLVFLPLEEKNWKIQVSSEGPPTVDATLTWNFDSGEHLPAHITGTRIIIWSFYPTWEGGITETLEWKTNVIAGPLGDEQRRSLRISPRRSFQLQLIANDQERRYLDMLAFSWGSRNWAVPVWNDVQELQTTVQMGDQYVPCQTFGRDFRVGGLMLFRGDDAFSFETAEISQITEVGLTLDRPVLSGWPKYTKIYPVRSARFAEQPVVTRLTDQAVSVACNFQISEVSDWAPSPGDETYRGYPVFRLPTEETESLTSTYLRFLQTLDNGTGLPRYIDTANLALTAQAYRWLMFGRNEQAAMRSLLYYLKGQFRSVWVPTHSEDFVLARMIPFDSVAMDVEFVGYTQFGYLQPGRRDIMITLYDGRVFFRRITASQEISPGVERLAIDTALGFDLLPSMVYRISYMARCRLEADTVEIDHQTDSDGVAACRVVFRSVRDDLV